MSEAAELIDDLNDDAPVEDAPVEKVAAVAPRTCKGAMPMCLVWYIKFHAKKDAKSEVAKEFFTTAGKISDIQSGANQKYIVEDMSFSDAELDEAIVKVKENFVRGQEADAAVPGSVTKRGLATTQPGDEEYSIAVIESIREMEEVEDAQTLEQARSVYNEANPRVKAAKTEAVQETADVETADADTEASPEDDDDLLD